MLVFSIFTDHGLAGGNADDQLQSLAVNGVERQYRLYVPPSYREGRPVPLVLDFHGSGSSPRAEAALSGFETLAGEKGFLVATPAARYHRRQGNVLTWNVDRDRNGVDDVEFVRALIGHIRARFSVDPDRIYAVGMSGGARMASRLACDLSGTLAAIAPVAGVRYPRDCRPAGPVPVITFHGRQDPVNHYSHREDSPPYWRMGVEKAVSGWVHNNQCSGSPEETAITAEVTRITYRGCRDDAGVVFYRSEDAGHTWPGSPMAGVLEEMGLGKTDADLPATRLIWSFFRHHPLGRGR